MRRAARRQVGLSTAARPDPTGSDRVSRLRVVGLHLLVWSTGAAAVAAGLLGGLDVWTGVCAAVAVVLLSVSTALLLRWPDGPTAFLVAIVLLAAVSPHPSVGQSTALVVTAAANLYSVDATQTGRGSADRAFWVPRLPTLALGAVLGVLLAAGTSVRLTASAWWLAAAGVAAAFSGIATILLVARAQRIRVQAGGR